MINASAPERLWTKDYVIVMIASSGISFCNYFFFSTLPIYAQNLSGSAVYAGLVTGVYTLAAMIIRPFSGILSDQFGRTKLLILGAFICSIACALYSFASGLILLIAVRALNGIGFGIHSTCAGAVAADVIPKARMTEGLGYFGLYGTIAAAVAPGIALLIIGSGELWRFQVLFVLATMVSFTSMIFDCFITYERNSENKLNGGFISAEQIRGDDELLPKTWLGFEYAVFVPAAIVTLLHVALSSVTSFLTLFALERGLGNVGLFFTFNAAGLFLSRLLCGKVVDRRGTDIVVIPAILVLAICLALVPFVDSLVGLYIVSVPLGLAQGAVVPAIYALMFNRCSPKRRGTVSAAFSSAIDIGYGFGSITFGFIAAGFNYYFVYWGAMLSTISALVIYWKGLATWKMIS